MKDLLSRLQSERTRRLTEDKLSFFKPYPKQLAFFAAGATVRERLLMAANQSGKTLASAVEIASHATGRYPEWWPGKRFEKPTHGWVVAVSNEVMRDTMQTLLLGRPGEHGTGMIPKDAIIDVVGARGIADLVDVIRIGWGPPGSSSGISTLTLKSAAAGREKFQGSTLDYVALDEESPWEIYSECLTRTNATRGLVFTTFTPLQGVSEVVRRFLYEKSDDRALISMTLDDVDHYDDEQRKQISESYQEHEREARTKGIPTMGSGRVFPVSQERISCDYREIPPYWPRIGGLDFGWDHPFAAVELAWDRDHDVVYLIRTYRQKETTPIIHSSVLRRWGKSLRWAWPHDGRNATLAGGGVPLKEQYEREGLNMIWDHAQFEDKSTSVEAGLMELLDRMKTGRFRVFHDLTEWFEEFHLYHRRDGKVYKEHDDLLDATRYALMMLRYAQTKSGYSSFNRGEIVYPKGYAASW